MSETVDRKEIEEDEGIGEFLMFVVWIDVNLGKYGPQDWHENSNPQQLKGALEEAVECREHGFPAKIVQENKSPREDGRFPMREPD